MPKLGHYKLTELKPAVLNSYFSSLTRDGTRKDGKPGGYSKGTIAKAKNTMSSVLSTAVEWELIEKNPLERVHFEAAPTAETLKFWTPEQCTAFLEFIEQLYQVTTKGHSRTDDTGIPYEVGDYTRTKELYRSSYNESHKEPLPVIPLHGLRHTSATLLIANNQDIRSVSARLGHAETSTTLNIYTHFLESTDKKAADILENVLVKHA